MEHACGVRVADSLDYVALYRVAHVENVGSSVQAVESKLRCTVSGLVTFGTSDGGQTRRRGRASAKAVICGARETERRLLRNTTNHHEQPGPRNRHCMRITRVMLQVPPPPPQWVLDLNSTSASKPKNASLADPPGYTASLTRKERSQATKNQRVPPTAEEMDTLKLKKAWEVAIAPAKQLPMNAFGASPHVRKSRHTKLIIHQACT
jgi:hypothetical protein